MSIFNKILGKLGIGKDAKEAAAPTKPAAAKPAPKPAVKPSGGKAMPGAAAGLAEKRAMMEDKRAAASEASMVDVMSKLETMAQGTRLDWKVSIVDLLKVLGIESSLEARKELATELGCPADKMNDSASMNVWLHKTVLKKIAENGGNIPQELLD